MTLQPTNERSKKSISMQSSELPIVLAMTGASGAIYAVRLLQQLLLTDQSVHLVYSPSAETVLWHELKIRMEGERSNQHDKDIHLEVNEENIDRTHSNLNDDLDLIVEATVSSSAPFGKRRQLSSALFGKKRLLLPMIEYCWPGEEKRWGRCPDAAQALSSGRLVVHHYQDYMTPIASGSFLTKGMVICPCSGATLSGVVHAAGNNLIQRSADVHLKEHRKLILVPRETPLSVFQLENMHRAAQAGAIVLPAMPGWYHGIDSIVDLIDFVVARILDHLDVPHQLMNRWGTPS